MIEMKNEDEDDCEIEEDENIQQILMNESKEERED